MGFDKETVTSSQNKYVSLVRSLTNKKIREKDVTIKVWQRSFHDHIIRGEKDYEKIWEYIEFNAFKWQEDCFYIE